MSAQEKTDLKKAISSFKISEKAGKITSSLKWTPEQKWMVLMGSILLGGTGWVAGSVHAKGSPGTTPGGDEGVTPSDSTGTEQPALDHGVEKEVAGGTITPGPNVNISSSHVTDQMSFAEAFNEARAECGPGSIFEWRGNVYNTYYQEEWVRLSAEDKQVFLKNVGFKPATGQGGTGGDGNSGSGQNTSPDPGIQGNGNNGIGNSGNNGENPAPEPTQFGDYRIVDGGDGKMWLYSDGDHDGVIDKVIYVQPDGVLNVFEDKTGDGSLDTVTYMIPNGTTSVNTIENPFTITVSKIDAGELGSVVEEGTYTPEETKGIVQKYMDYAAEGGASVPEEGEEVVPPVDSITHEVVITDAPPVEDEDYDNDIDVV